MKKLIATLVVCVCIVALVAEEKINIFKNDLTVVQVATASVDSIKLEENKTELVLYKNDKTSVRVPVSSIDSLTIDDVPNVLTVKTKTMSQIALHSARIGVEITEGESPVVECGVVWNTMSSPNIRHNKTILNNAYRDDCFELTDLESNTVYYARAFATTESGTTTYGNEVFFTTENPLPVVSTSSTTYTRKTNSVVLVGNVAFEGAEKLIERGFCYSTKNQNPTINDEKIVHPSAETGRFSLTKTELGHDHDYYVRAYATSEAGTAYGKVMRVVPVMGDVKYHLVGLATPQYMGERKFNMLVEALDSACYYFNRYTGYVANIRVDCHEGVPTAEASHWGQMKWGVDERYIFVGTVMHEMCHYFGSGTQWRWLQHQNEGFGGMTHTHALVNKLTNGAVTRLYAGGSHFWPFGCNQREEVAAGIDGKYRNEEYLTIMAKLVWEMRLDCSWETGE